MSTQQGNAVGTGQIGLCLTRTLNRERLTFQIEWTGDPLPVCTYFDKGRTPVFAYLAQDSHRFRWLGGTHHRYTRLNDAPFLMCDLRYSRSQDVCVIKTERSDN